MMSQKRHCRFAARVAKQGEDLSLHCRAKDEPSLQRNKRGTALKKALRTKLAERAGFTLAEQLVSMVFIGLLCVVVSAGIGAVLATYGNVASTANANNLLSRSMQEINDQLAYALKVEIDAQTGEAWFVSAATNTLITFTNVEDGIAIRGDRVGGLGVDSVLLIPGADGLQPSFVELPQYNEVNETWSYRLQIIKDGHVLKEQQMLVTRVTSVV